MSMDNKVQITSPNLHEQKDLMEEYVLDEGSKNSKNMSKEETMQDNLNFQYENNIKSGLLTKEEDTTQQGRSSIIKFGSQKLINEDRDSSNPAFINRLSYSNKGISNEPMNRRSIKSEIVLGESYKARLSGGNSSHYQESFRAKDLTLSYGEDQTIFSYSKGGPIRYKMKKGESQIDSNVQEQNLIEKIKKRMNHFINNFTNSGKKKFYEKASVHRTLNDKSDGFFDVKSRIPLTWLISLISKKIMKSYSNSCISKIAVMNQQSMMSILTELIFILYNSLFFFLLSIMIVFPNVLISEQVYIYRITLGIWAVQVLIKLNTSTHHNSNLITNRRHILFQYLKKQGICDLISSLLLITLFWREYTNYSLDEGWNTQIIAQILTFIKLYNLMLDLEEFQRQLCMIMKRYYIVKLINLIGKLFIIAHVIACMWYLVGKIEIYYMGEDITWQDKSIAQDQVWWKIYLLSMNWSLTLMTTSQSTGTTVLQIFFSTFIMLFTTIISGYMLNATGHILIEIDASEENKRNDLNIINDYMRKKSISLNLQRRVNIYLDYYYQKNYQKSAEDTQNVLAKISTELSQQMKKEYFYQILKKIDFLQHNYTVDSLQNIAVFCEEVIYFPNQIIFEENNYDDAALLIIIEGSVEIYQSVGPNSNEQKTICYLNEGNILGQINFFTGMARTACARSNGFTKLAKISRDSFMQVIKDNDQDIQTFYQIKDNILLYESYQEMNIKCSACQSFNHLQGACSLVHFNKEYAMQRVRVSNQIKQRRKDQIRLKQRKNNTFKSLQQVQEKNMQFLSNLVTDANYYTQFEYDEGEDDFGDLSPGNLRYLNSIVEQADEEEHNISQVSSSQNNILKLTGKTPVTSIQLSQMSQTGDSNQQEMKKLIGNQINQQLQNKPSLFQQGKSKIQQNQILPEESIISQNIEAIKRQNSKQMLNSQELHRNKQMTQIPQEMRIATPQKLKNIAFDFDFINQSMNQSTDRDLKESFQGSPILGQLDQPNHYKYVKDSFYWSFDRQKDYDFYFNHGNSFIKLHQYKLYQKQKERQSIRTLNQNSLNKKGRLTRGSVFLKQKISTIGINQHSQQGQPKK